MKDSDARGYAPLYVRSFQSWMGEEVSMSNCFQKARQMAPCVLILEDLDSLINDQNRSFFLNQLDGELLHSPLCCYWLMCYNFARQAWKITTVF